MLNDGICLSKMSFDQIHSINYFLSNIFSNSEILLANDLKYLVTKSQLCKISLHVYQRSHDCAIQIPLVAN